MFKEDKHNKLIVSFLDHLKKSEKNINISSVASSLGIPVKELYNIRSGSKKGTNQLFQEITRKFPDEFESFTPPSDQEELDYQAILNEMSLQLKYLREENERLRLDKSKVNEALKGLMKLIESKVPENELRAFKNVFERENDIKLID